MKEYIVSVSDKWSGTNQIFVGAIRHNSELIRCKDCKYRIVDKRYGKMCDLDTGDPHMTGRNADNDEWFCADAERKEE